jgi:hypothetical protein
MRRRFRVFVSRASSIRIRRRSRIRYSKPANSSILRTCCRSNTRCSAASRSTKPRHRSCSGLRTVASGVLSGPACSCAAGPRGLNSPQARPSGSAQTYSCRPGVRAPAARGIAVADDRRIDHTRSAAVRCGRAPAHYRTAFSPAGKKTQLIIASADAPSRVDLAAFYEQLRRLDGGRGLPGCALLQRHGMKSWIESCLRVCRPSLPVCPPHHPPPTTDIPFCGDVVQLIAEMVLEIHQQGAIP